jgi:hypothetical protein
MASQASHPSQRGDSGKLVQAFSQVAVFFVRLGEAGLSECGLSGQDTAEPVATVAVKHSAKKRTTPSTRQL